jgi:predicted transcriptional regulator
MKTRVSYNSLLALATVNLSKRQKQVLNCIEETGSITAKGISFMLNLPINHITGRITELMHKQLIRVKTTVKDVTNSSQRVNLYVVREAHDPLNVFEQSWEEKYNDLYDWLKKENPLLLYKYDLLHNHEL